VGGRYTPKGGKPALYLASSADTALAEVDAVLSIGGRLALVGARPFTVLQVRVQLRDVLDLREESTVSLLGTTFQELTGNWRLSRGLPPTHALGDLMAADARFDGLIAPSAKVPSEAVLVVFTERLSEARGTFCEVEDGGTLSQRL
jgi:RES domain-containing protein